MWWSCLSTTYVIIINFIFFYFDVRNVPLVPKPIYDYAIVGFVVKSNQFENISFQIFGS